MAWGDMAKTALEEAGRAYKELVALSGKVDNVAERVIALREELRGQVSQFEARQTHQQDAFETRIVAQLTALESKLSQEQRAIELKLSQQLTALESKLSQEQRAAELKLSQEQHALENKVVERLDRMQQRIDSAQASASEALAMFKGGASEALKLVIESRVREEARQMATNAPCLVSTDRTPPSTDPQ